MIVIALLLLGTLTGNELAISAFVHPALARLANTHHIASAQSIARVYGKYAPFWYAATLLALVALIWRTRLIGSEGLLFGVSAVLMVVALALTLIGLVPINNRISSWDLDDLPPNWKSERSRWDMLHAVRVAVLLGSLIALAFGVTRA